MDGVVAYSIIKDEGDRDATVSIEFIDKFGNVIQDEYLIKLIQ